MEISPYMLLLLLIYSFLFGVSAGVLNDINRIIKTFCGVQYSKKRFDALYDRAFPLIGRLPRLRGEKKGRKIFISILMFFQDILLFVYLGCGIVVLNYYFNRGEFRFYTVFAACVGFVLYYFTVGKLVVPVFEVIVFFLRVAVRTLTFILIHPFVLAFSGICRLIRTGFEKSVNSIAKRAQMRYNKKRREELVENSLRGFSDKLNWYEG